MGWRLSRQRMRCRHADQYVQRKHWSGSQLTKSAHQCPARCTFITFHREVSPTCTLLLSLECSARELIVTERHTLRRSVGCLVARLCVAVRPGSCEADCRVFSLSPEQYSRSSEMEQVLEGPRGTRYGVYHTQMTWCNHAPQQQSGTRAANMDHTASPSSF